MSGVKTHKISAENMRYALKVNNNRGLLTKDMETACGKPGYWVSVHWKSVDCKLCLRKKESKETEKKS